MTCSLERQSIRPTILPWKVICKWFGVYEFFDCVHRVQLFAEVHVPADRPSLYIVVGNALNWGADLLVQRDVFHLGAEIRQAVCRHQCVYGPGVISDKHVRRPI